MDFGLLGYRESALKDADCALMEARQIEHAATLMFTLNFPILINTYCGNYDAANERIKELVVLAEEKGAPFRKAEGVLRRGYVLTLRERPRRQSRWSRPVLIYGARPDPQYLRRST